MATVSLQPQNKSKYRLQAARIDMTPMVDLGFLLITFFIFTTSIAEPRTTKLVMPKESDTTMPVPKKTLLTALVDRNDIYVYEGTWEEAIATDKVVRTNYNMQTGFGQFIRKKQASLAPTDQKEDLFVAIKPLPTASYQSVLNALDEMQINGVIRYGIMNLSGEEKVFMNRQQLRLAK